MKNPWLSISAEDYEGHMSSENVGQLKVLSEIFKDVVEEFNPDSLMMLGCTGNGLEHLSGNENVLGIDINPVYISKCKERFNHKIPKLELICADLYDFECQPESFSLIHAALIFEFVDAEILLPKISCWLRSNGYFSVVLQLENKFANAISDTEYESLKTLSPIQKLLNADEFVIKCDGIGLRKINEYEVSLTGGKIFQVFVFQKTN